MAAESTETQLQGVVGTLSVIRLKNEPYLCGENEKKEYLFFWDRVQMEARSC
jgi:hypothetical protein